MHFESFRISCFHFRCLKTVTGLQRKAFGISPLLRTVLTKILVYFTEYLLCSLQAEQHRIYLPSFNTDVSHPRPFYLYHKTITWLWFTFSVWLYMKSKSCGMCLLFAIKLFYAHHRVHLEQSARNIHLLLLFFPSSSARKFSGDLAIPRTEYREEQQFPWLYFSSSWRR